MNKQSILIVLGIFLGFLLSFVGLGIMWIGIPPHYQFINAAPFFLLAMIISKNITPWFAGAIAPAIGALPVALLFVQFRDKENSHLMPTLLVFSWFFAISIGAFLGSKIKKN